MARLRLLLVLAMIGSSVLGTVGARADHGSAISGTVTDDASIPIENVCVIAYEWDVEFEDYYYIDETLTAPDGTYTVNVYPADVIVEFADCGEGIYIGEWYDDAQGPYGALAIQVEDEAHHVQGIDAALERGGSISGVVTDEISGDPVQVCVWAEADSEPFAYGSTYSSEDGTYRIGGLPGGTYRVQFASCGFDAVPVPEGPATSSIPPPSSETYVSEWYDDHRYYSDADPVLVVAGTDTPGIDAALIRGASISGAISEDGGGAIDYACVDVYDVATGDWAGWAEAYSGFYTVGGLRPGDYKVNFYDCWDGEYESEWFDDKRSYSAADVITLGLAEQLTGIDASLAIAPMPDLALTGLRVEQVPVGVAGNDLPLSTGWEHDVTVEVSNLGDERGSGYLTLWAETRSDRSRQMIGALDISRLGPGQVTASTFAWNATGNIGDTVVVAQICSFDQERTYNNNNAAARTYSVVGGTGIGLTSPLSSPDYWYPCWDYYEE